MLCDMTTATTRKNRRTGSTVTAREDDFLGWITVCETHGGYAEHPNKTAARDWLAEPTMWCEGCAEAVTR